MINDIIFLKKVLKQKQTTLNEKTIQAIFATAFVCNDAVRLLIGDYKKEIDNAVSCLDFKKWKKFNYKLLVLGDALFEGAKDDAKDDATTLVYKEVVKWFK